MRSVQLYRQHERRYGSAWTLFVRLGRFFFEVNFGRDLT